MLAVFFKFLHGEGGGLKRMAEMVWLHIEMPYVMWSEIGCGSRDPDYMDLKNGRTQQKLCAQELHQKAGLPEGPCGIPELNKFQQILTEIHRPNA